MKTPEDMKSTPDADHRQCKMTCKQGQTEQPGHEAVILSVIEVQSRARNVCENRHQIAPLVNYAVNPCSRHTIQLQICLELNSS